MFRLNYDPANFSVELDPLSFANSAPGGAGRFLNPSAAGGPGDRPALNALTSCEVLDYFATDSFTAQCGNSLGPRSTLAAMPPGQFLVLYNPAGWGRDLDVVLQCPACFGALCPQTPPGSGALPAYLFGDYAGPLFLTAGDEQGLYAPYFAPPGDPVFPFAPDLIPLYGLHGDASSALQPSVLGGEEPWPSYIAWPTFTVAFELGAGDPTLGQTHLQSAAVAWSASIQSPDFGVAGFGHDGFDHIDVDGSTLASGPRNIKLICLPIACMALPDLRLAPGRDLVVAVTVNGEAAGEISLLRWSRPPHLATATQTHLPLDELASADLLAGALRQRLPLFACEGPGEPLALALTYSSEASLYYRGAAREPVPSAAVWAPFGQGWACLYYSCRVLGPAMDLTDPAVALGLAAPPTGRPSPDCLLVQDFAGHVDVFQRDYDPADQDPTELTTYRPAAKSTWRALFPNAPGEVTLLDTGNGFTLQAGGSGDVYSFGDDGRLTSLQRPTYGYGLQIAWTGDDFTATDSSGRTLSAVSDGAGHIAQITDPATGVWTFTYDGPSLTAVQGPDGPVAGFRYDADTFVMTQRQLPGGRMTAYAYGYNDGAPQWPVWGALIGSDTTAPGAVRPGAAEAQPLSHTLETQVGAGLPCSYGGPSLTVTHRNPRQNAAALSATGFSIICNPAGPAKLGTALTTLEITAADASATQVRIDDEGLLTGITLASGVEIEMAAAPQPDLVSAVNYPDGGVQQYDYGVPDPANPDRLGQCDCGTGTVETYAYGAPQVGGATSATSLLLTLKVTETTSGATLYAGAYGWTAPGDLTSVMGSDGRQTTYAYDYDAGSGRRGLKSQEATALGGAAADTVAFDYDGYGRLKQRSTPQETRDLVHDSFGRLIAETITTPAAVHRRTLVYAAAAGQATFTDADGSTLVGAYDTQGCLQSLVATDASGAARAWTFTPDANGNIVQIAAANGDLCTFTYDAMDRQTASTGPAPMGMGGLAFPEDLPRLCALPSHFRWPSEVPSEGPFPPRLNSHAQSSAPDLTAALGQAITA